MLESLNLITSHNVKTNEEHKGTEIYFTEYPTAKERETLKAHGFRWSSFNKCWYIKTDKLTSGTVKTVKAHKSRKADKPKAVNKYGVEVGDLYCASFGYDMTLLNFFQVTKIIGESMVEVTEIRQKCVDGYAGYSGHSVPVKNSFIGEPIRKKITLLYGGNTEPKKENTCFKDEHHHAYYTTETAKHYFNHMD